MYFEEEEAEINILELIQQYENYLTNHIGTINFSEEEFERLIIHYIENLEPQLALDASQLAISKYPYSSEFILTKAQAYLELNLLEDAMNTLDHHLIDKTDVNYFFILSNINYYNREFSKAIDILDEALTICEDSHDFLLNFKAEILKEIGEYDQMIPILHQSLDYDPENTRTFMLLDNAYNMTSRNDQKIDFFKKMLEDNPFNVDAWYFLGLSHIYNNDIELAIEAFEYLLAIEPHSEGMIKLYCLYYESSRYQDAIDIIKEFNKIAELSDIEMAVMASCYKNIGDFKNAKKLYNEVIMSDFNNSTIHFELAEIYCQESNFNIALPLIQKAIEIEPETYIYYELSAIVHCALEDYEMAIETCDYLISNNPDEIKYYEQKSEIYLLMEEEKLAHNLLDNVIVEKEMVDLYYQKCLLYYIKENYSAAYINFEKGLLASPDAHILFLDQHDNIARDPIILNIIHDFEA